MTNREQQVELRQLKLTFLFKNLFSFFSDKLIDWKPSSGDLCWDGLSNDSVDCVQEECDSRRHHPVEGGSEDSSPVDTDQNMFAANGDCHWATC